MPNPISEDNIEQAIVPKLQILYGYESMNDNRKNCRHSHSPISSLTSGFCIRHSSGANKGKHLAKL